MIFQKVQETIASHNLIKSDEHIVLGLSGGPDSVCLFHILLRLRQTLGIRLHPVHVNHGLRPGAAERDQNYVGARGFLQSDRSRLSRACRSMAYDQ